VHAGVAGRKLVPQDLVGALDERYDVIFSRGQGRHARRPTGRPGGRPPSGRTDPDELDLAGLDSDDGDFDEGLTIGPYDAADAPAGQRLDLGALEIPVVEGVEVRVQADGDGQIQQVVLVHAGNLLQLGVFAAPRSEGIWDEVRADIRKSLVADGARPEEARGEYGIELRARLRGQDGPLDLRFVGVDGPRWMVRAVYQGKAATDPRAAAPLTACLRGLVVNRGSQAMPVRDPLPLHLPRELQEEVQAQAQGGGGIGASEHTGLGGPLVNGATPHLDGGSGAGSESTSSQAGSIADVPRGRQSPRTRRPR
jgi:hypothetical protein